jgi:hypothetical protein
MTFFNAVPYVAYYSGGSHAIEVKRPAASGTGWEIVGRRINVTNVGANISLVVNNSRLYIVYTSDNINIGRITVKRLKTDGSDWELIGTEGFSAGQAAYVSMAFNGTTPYVAYQDAVNAYKTTVMKLNTAGTGWEVVGKAGFGADKVYYTSLAFNGATPYVAYGEGSNLQAKVMKLNTAGTDWEAVGQTAFSSLAASYIKLVFNGSTPYVTYEEGRQKATVKKLNAAGTGWETVGTAGFTAGIATDISLAFNSGVPYVAYADYPNVSRLNVVKLNAGGTDWVNVGRADFSSGAASFVTLAFNGAIPYVGFSDQGYERKPRVMKLNTAGTDWEALSTSGASAGLAFGTNIVLNGSTPYIAYRDNGNNNEISVIKYNATKSAWEGVGNSGFAFPIGSINTVPLAFQGTTPYVACLAGANSAKATVMRLNKAGTAWETVGPAGFSSGNVTGQAAIAVSGTTPYIIYNDQVVNVRRLNAGGTAWETVGNPFTVASTGYVSIVFKGTVPYIAFGDAGNGGKTTVMRLNTAGTWEVVGTPGFASSSFLSLAFSGDIPYVACAGASQKLYLYRLKADGTGWESMITPSSSDSGVGFISLTFDGETPYISTVRDNNGASVVTYNAAGTDWQDVGGYQISSADALNTSMTILDHKLYLAYDSYGVFVKTYALANVQSASTLQAGAGSTVTLTGTGFTGATAVTFGGVPAQSFKVVSPTSITAVIGNGASGDIKVVTPSNITTLKGFVYAGAPAISSFTPTSGGKSIKVTITGSNFTGATAVKFGTTAAASFTVNSATNITTTTGAGATGKISVITPGGTGTSAASFTYFDVPVISSFTPTQGVAGTKVNLTGTGFTGATAVTFGGVPARLFTVYSATEITAVVDDASKTGKIAVTTPGGTATSTATFTFLTTPAPTIGAFQPTQAYARQSVYITGTGFTGATDVSFGGVPVLSFTINSATAITAIVGLRGATGDVVVTTPTGTATLKGFTFIPAPVVTSFKPVAATTGATITITGKNFLNVSKVSFQNVDASGFVVQSENLITAVVGSGTNGAVQVTAPAGIGSLDGFTFVPKPSIKPAGNIAIETGASITLNANVATGNTYQWVKDGKNITGATQPTYNATAAGSYVVKVTNTGFTVTSDPTVVTVIFDLPADNFKVSATSATCKGENNGIINIAAVQSENYVALVKGPNSTKSYTFSNNTAIDGLSPGTYNVCITVTGQPNFQQCFDLVITEPKDLAVYSSINKTTNSLDLELNGSDNYAVELNGTVYHTTESSISLPLMKGSNKLIVATDKLCQGIIEKTINVSDSMVPYPNPFQDILNINLGDAIVASCIIRVYNIADGKLLSQQKFGNQSGVIQLNLSGLRSGTYSLNMSMDNRESVFKIIKK